MTMRPNELAYVITGSVVERAVELDADLDDVWRALTDPDQTDGWLGSAVDLDLRPGGGGIVVDDDGAIREVLVIEVDAPHRLVWHWWHEDGPLSTVEITVTPTSAGTIVRVVETLDPEARLLRARATSGGRAMAWAPAEPTGSDWSARLGRLRLVAGRPLVVGRG